MPLVDDLKVWGDDARRALAPGEALLAITSVGVAYGAPVAGGPKPAATYATDFGLKS